MSAPKELADESLRQLARSFYVVKMVRYAALLVASLAIAALAAGRGAPGWVPVALVLLAVALAAAMARTRARYVSAQRRLGPGSAPSTSASPTG